MIPMEYGSAVPRVDAARQSVVKASQESANRAGSGFLLTEVAAGITFADLALASEDAEKRRRNISKAVTVYRAIVRFVDRAVFTEPEASQFLKSFGLLEDKLLQLGGKSI